MPAKLLMQSELLIGNPKSNIALCTLWSKREEIASQLDKKNFFACGNLYSFDGINSLLRNIFLNPSIRFLVVTGKDLNGSGEALLLFFSKGVDAGHYIIGTRHCIERELPSEKLELLRQSVKALDFRNSGIQELKETLAGISKQKTTPFSEPLVFPSSIPSAEALSSEQAGFLVRDSSISNAWLKIVSLIMRFGSEKPSEYGLKQKELINVVAVVNPLDENIPAFIVFSKKELEE
jgi:tetrahydromethanopterin S-methyltransferase subunit A